MSNIALCHFRTGETDGVSLEMDKWKKSLEKQGHKVYFISGKRNGVDSLVIEELFYKQPSNDKFVRNAYEKFTDYKTEIEFKNDMLEYAKIIEERLISLIDEYKLDILVPNNIWSLGWGLSAGVGFVDAVKKTGIKCVTHHHDFYWEREKYDNPTCEFIGEWLEEYFPPKMDNISHVVINKIAQKELKDRKGLESTVVPNVFDFAEEVWKLDDYNKDLRERIGLKESDIVFLQATRIAKRKGIELALDVLGELGKKKYLDVLRNHKLYDGRTFTVDNKIVFIFAGMDESEEGYLDILKKKAKSLNVEIMFINELIKAEREESNGTKKYSLWDAYVLADIVTYPSLLEGWGNQFLEAVFAKKPVLVYEYPVYGTDIKEKGFEIISLGDKSDFCEKKLANVHQKIVEKAAEQCIIQLTNNRLREVQAELNFDLGKKYYSYESLGEILSKLL
ncbi:MAG: glycosyltransferase [Alkaliphilus sp.]